MYSDDFKTAVKHAHSLLGSMRKVAELLGLAVSTVSRWLKAPQSSIVDHSKPHGIWMRSEMVTTFIRNVVEDSPFVTRLMLRKRIQLVFQFAPSLKLITSTLRACKLSRVKSRVKCEGKSPACDEDFRKFAALWAAGDAVAVDECGFQTQHIPLRGYTRTGTRLRVRSKENSRKWITATVAISARFGHVASLKNASQSGHGFAAFVRSLPFPTGTVIVMDNASIHKTRAVREALAAKEYSPMYIPAYSPDFNPIENIFGVVKTAWRRHNGSHHSKWIDAPHTISTLFRRIATPGRVMSQFQHTARTLRHHG